MVILLKCLSVILNYNTRGVKVNYKIIFFAGLGFGEKERALRIAQGSVVTILVLLPLLAVMC